MLDNDIMEYSYAPSIISEHLAPEIAYSQAKKISTMVVDDQSVILYPKSGSTSINQGLQGTNQLEFTISSTPYMIDPQSVNLVMDVQLGFAGVANTNCSADRVVPQDNFCPWFYISTVLLGGMQHESIQDCDLLTHHLTWDGVSRDDYQTKVSFANPGARRWAVGGAQSASEYQSATVFPANLNYSNELELATAQGWAAASAVGGTNNGTASAVRSLVIPLQYLAIFSGQVYLPPQVGSNITLRFTTNQLSRMFFTGLENGNANANALTSITFSNIRLVYRSVQVADEVLGMIERMSASAPIHIPCVHHQVQTDSCDQTGGSVNGPDQYLLNVATSNLVSTFHYYVQPEQLNGSLPLNYRINPGYAQTGEAWMQIGGKVFPSVNRAVGVNMLYHEYSKALSAKMCTEACYYQGVAAVAADTDYHGGAFTLGFSTERVLGAISDLASAGYSTKSAAGAVRLFLAPRDSIADSVKPTDRVVSVLRFLEYIIIGANGISSTNLS